jgi:NAD-specific glutamate dehydrogenase
MEKCLKTLTKQQKTTTKTNNFKKQIKKTSKTALSLQLFLMANFDRINGPIDMTDSFH